MLPVTLAILVLPVDSATELPFTGAHPKQERGPQSRPAIVLALTCRQAF